MEQIYCSNDYDVVRFPCDCMAQEHSMDVEVEIYDGKERDGRERSHIYFNMYLAGKADLKWRIKQAWSALRGRDGQVGDFILRDEDVPKLIEFLEKYNL